ncbi:hypothetical protein BKK80_18890 [Cupriavidus malaysiensis]|uniref:Uncharacterized protein n=1 Tax=Cupriavidus malaysiensis TaxID=367825 RepID=A0A1D9I6B6_9BURK|nr:hypothetical protein BKK80_18890 [Cupriavidus malaysiensis]
MGMGRVDALLDECARLFAGGACIRKAYLRKAAEGKEVFLALEAVLPPPEFALTSRNRPPPSDSFRSRSVGLADLIFVSVSRFSGIVGLHRGEKYPHG